MTDSGGRTVACRNTQQNKLPIHITPSPRRQKKETKGGSKPLKSPGAHVQPHGGVVSGSSARTVHLLSLHNSLQCPHICQPLDYSSTQSDWSGVTCCLPQTLARPKQAPDMTYHTTLSQECNTISFLPTHPLDLMTNLGLAKLC